MTIIEELQQWLDDTQYSVAQDFYSRLLDEMEMLRNALHDIQDMPEDWESDEEMNLLFVIDNHVRIAKEALGMTEEKE
jgi:hypothetical protein